LRPCGVKQHFQNQDIFPIGLTAKSSSDGNIYVKTSSATQFRLIKKTLLVNKIDFHTFSLTTDRQLKVLIKGILTDISIVELEKELVARNFEVQLIKRFGPVDKPMPICLVYYPAPKQKKYTNSRSYFTSR